jgi:hypothetical protein
LGKSSGHLQDKLVLGTLILGKAQRIAEYLAIALLEIFLVARVDFAIDQLWLKCGAIVPANARSAGKSGANIPA